MLRAGRLLVPCLVFYYKGWEGTVQFAFLWKFAKLSKKRRKSRGMKINEHAKEGLKIAKRKKDLLP